MPKINEVLLKVEGFQYAKSLDLNMVYSHIWLIKNASNFCTIILPWGKYRYKHLPTGVANSPDIFQHTKRSNKKYGKLRAKLDEEIPCNKVCVDLIGPYFIRRKGKKENLHLKAVTMIDPVTGWF